LDRPQPPNDAEIKRLALRLTRFYAQYDVTKLRDIGNIIDRYWDQQEELFVALVTKYGAEPDSENDEIKTFEQRLTCFYAHYDATKLKNVGKIIDKYWDQQDELFAALVTKYGAELPPELSIDDSGDMHERAPACPSGKPSSHRAVVDDEPAIDDPARLQSSLPSKCVIVYAGSSSTIGTSYRLLLQHSLTISQFSFAQFHHPRQLAQFEAIIVSGDGRYAAMARDNQLKYHPKQKVSAYALEEAATLTALTKHARSWDAPQKAQFLFLQILTSGGAVPNGLATPKLRRAPRRTAQSSAATAVSEALADDASVLVYAGSSATMPEVHRQLLRHSLSASEFIFAQFYHPKTVAEYSIVFVSGNGGHHAQAMRGNQRKYHPRQRAVAFTLSGPVVATLVTLARNWGATKDARVDFLRLLASARVPYCDSGVRSL
jgi:hypothetical protein